MSTSKTHNTESPLMEYVMENSLRLHKAQKALNEESLSHPKRIMLGDTIVLQLTSNLIKLIGGKKILDIGVYTGASALSAALAIPEGGKVYALDVTDDYLEIGRKFWKEAGVDKKIELILGPALDTLKKLITGGQSGTFDFAFIDADKQNYVEYYEHCLTLIRSGGVIAIDNTLWGGNVINELPPSESTKAILELNSKLKDDQRINLSFLMIGDGLSLCFKK